LQQDFHFQKTLIVKLVRENKKIKTKHSLILT